MHKFLVKLFIKDYQNTSSQEVRTKYGTLAGIVGIISNIILAALKITVGIIAASSALIADGINNLSDSLSSIITLVGFKLSSREADEDHPFGHQRYEYITGLIISFIILLIGFTLAKESVVGIIALIKHTADHINVDNKILIFASLIFSFVIKFWQSSFYKKMANDVDSETLKASSKDSLNDCITTLAVFISTIIYIISKEKVNIDSIASLFVSIFIIISSINLIKDTINPLLGEVPSKQEMEDLCHLIISYDGILGVHDLVIHNYGPNRKFVTCHAEVSREVDVMESHDLIDNIEREIGKQLKIDLTIHMDPIEVHDKYTNEIKEEIKEILHNYDETLKFHDFRIVRGPTHTNVIFDVVIPIKYPLKPDELKKELTRIIKEHDSSWYAIIQVDQFLNRLTNEQ